MNDNDDHTCLTEGMLTIKQAMRLLDLSEWVIRGLCQNRKLTHYRLSNRYLFKREDLEEYLRESRIEATKDDESKVTPRPGLSLVQRRPDGLKFKHVRK